MSGLDEKRAQVTALENGKLSGHQRGSRDPSDPLIISHCRRNIYAMADHLQIDELKFIFCESKCLKLYLYLKKTAYKNFVFAQAYLTPSLYSWPTGTYQMRLLDH